MLKRFPVGYVKEQQEHVGVIVSHFPHLGSFVVLQTGSVPQLQPDVRVLLLVCDDIFLVVLESRWYILPRKFLLCVCQQQAGFADCKVPDSYTFHAGVSSLRNWFGRAAARLGFAGGTAALHARPGEGGGGSGKLAAYQRTSVNPRWPSGRAAGGVADCAGLHEI